MLIFNLILASLGQHILVNFVWGKVDVPDRRTPDEAILQTRQLGLCRWIRDDLWRVKIEIEVLIDISQLPSDL